MINLFGSRPNNTSLPKSPSESVQYPMSRMQWNKCMFVNQLMDEAMVEMVDELEVLSYATQQLIIVFRDSVAKQ